MLQRSVGSAIHGHQLGIHIAACIKPEIAQHQHGAVAKRDDIKQAVAIHVAKGAQMGLSTPAIRVSKIINDQIKVIDVCAAATAGYRIERVITAILAPDYTPFAKGDNIGQAVAVPVNQITLVPGFTEIAGRASAEITHPGGCSGEGVRRFIPQGNPHGTLSKPDQVEVTVVVHVRQRTDMPVFTP